MINELRNYVTNGRMPCVSLHHAPLVGASKEDAQRGEQSYSSLAKNLEGKKTVRPFPPFLPIFLFGFTNCRRKDRWDISDLDRRDVG